MSGQLCLKWNNHAIAFENLLSKIYLEDTYSDATILCHGKFYPVHRFVLSTCSEYFEEMFRQCIRLNNKHPFIIVKDVQPEQMEALLNYMYKGEVNVPQEMLPELIKAAEAFKIKGLAVSDDEPTPKSRKRSNISSPAPISKRSRRQEDKSPSNNLVDRNNTSSELASSCDNSASSQAFPSSSKSADDIPLEPLTVIKDEPTDIIEPIAIIDDSDDGIVSVKHEEQTYDPYNENKTIVESFDFDVADDNFNESQESTSWDNSQVYEGGDGSEDNPADRFSNERLPSMAEIDISKLDDRKVCPYRSCSFRGANPAALVVHIRTHTGEKPFQCPYCDHRAAQKGSIEKHIRCLHMSEKPFHCEHCSYKTSRKDTLTKHIRNQH